MVGAIETIGDGVAIQRVSRRRPRATDFRLVQGALNADGMGNLLSGLIGTPPNTTYSSSISLAELTGVAARRVGVYVGAIFAVLALSPKVTALLIAIPNPVGAAYVTLLIGLLFVQGMKLVVEDGINHRKAVVVGLSFWLGVGFQNQVIFADLLGGTWGTLLGNGMTAGCLTAIVLTAFMELTAARRRRLEVELAVPSMPKIDEFLRAVAAKVGWDGPATERLCATGEETLAILVQQAGDDEAAHGRHLILTARPTERGGRVGVFGRGRGGKSRRPAGLPERTARDNRRKRDFVPPAAALRLFGAAPEIPRSRHHCGTGRAYALEAVCKLWWSSFASNRSRLDSRFRGNDGSRFYGVFNRTQGGFSDSLLSSFQLV